MSNPVIHWEIISAEAKKLRGFYGELFNWQINDDNPMQYGLVASSEGGGIDGGIGPSLDGSGSLTIYVQVADLEATLEKVESLGGQTVMPPVEIPNMVTFAKFSDPDGNIVGLVKEDSGSQ